MRRRQRHQQVPTPGFGLNQMIVSAALFSCALWTVSLFALYVF
jgi:hypothetical protein